MAAIINKKLTSAERLSYSGKKVAHPLPENEVIVTGISGAYPSCETYDDFITNLMNKQDLCVDMKKDDPDMPKYCGKLLSINEFDAGFFGISYTQAKYTEPACRLLLPKIIEAIFDAGYHLDEMRGTRTGLFLGICFYGNEGVLFNGSVKKCDLVSGNLVSMVANRISHYLQVNGPSITLDTACSSGIYTFELAYRALLEGKCDKAIVCSSSLCTSDVIFRQFVSLGVLNMDTGCRPFDIDGQGYTRSEAIVALILERRSDAKRIYAKVVHSKCNADGFKAEGITFPGSESQRELLETFYADCDVDPNALAFLELHATGTKVGDGPEMLAVSSLFGKKEQLLIGSHKGNIGHTEPSSGLCGISKVIAAMDREIIAPNIHFKEARADIAPFLQRQFKIVVEPTAWPKSKTLAGVNCFGFGGANGHVLLEQNAKQKALKSDHLPRLICLSGRNHKTIDNLQNALQRNALDYELISHLQHIYRYKVDGFNHKGYIILDEHVELARTNSFNVQTFRNVYLNIGAPSCNCFKTIKEMSKFKIFADTYNEIKLILQQNKIAMDLDTETKHNLMQNTIHSTCVQIGLINLLKQLGIVFDSVNGSSIGIFTSSYATGTLDLAETIQCIYHVTQLFVEQQQSANHDEFVTKLYNQLNTIITKKKCQNGSATEAANGHTDSDTNLFNKEGTPEYFLHHILNPKKTSEHLTSIKRSIFINIDDEQHMLSNKTNKNQIVNFNCSDLTLIGFLTNIGMLYELGLQPQVHQLYPQIELPMSRGTPHINSLFKWNNKTFANVGTSDRFVCESAIDFNYDVLENKFYQGHIIDGRVLFPATGYLIEVAKCLGKHHNIALNRLKLTFENVKFIKASRFNSAGDIFLYVTVTRNGCFEVIENSVLLVSGHVTLNKPHTFTSDIYDDSSSNMDDFPLMEHKDVYKEIRLRGYNYKGVFRSIQQVHANRALIKWCDNMIAFLDNMLQVQLLQRDTRALYVPIGIDFLHIDMAGHYAKLAHYTKDNNNLIPVTFNSRLGMVRSDSIEMRGLQAAAITRKKQSNPILESYEFVANSFTAQTIDESARIIVQVILENTGVAMTTLRSHEFITTVNHDSISTTFSESIYTALEDLPIIQPDLTVISEHPIGITNSAIQLFDAIQTNQANNNNNALVICYNAIHDEEAIKTKFAKLLIENGFLIVIETKEYTGDDLKEFDILLRHCVIANLTYIYLLRHRHRRSSEKQSIVIDMSSNKVDSWLVRVQQQTIAATAMEADRDVVLFAQRNDLSGILGYVNCLRKEPNAGDRFKCFFIQDHRAGKFDLTTNTLYREQLKKGLAVNVFKGGMWGTYRHIMLPTLQKTKAKHYYAECTRRGNLSNLDWLQGHLSEKQLSNHQLINVHYSAINFKDVMLASGKIPIESVATDRRTFDYLNGFEFSGVTNTGERVMGVGCGAMTNLLEREKLTLWTIPDSWTLDEGATVPCVYLTSLYALLIKSNLQTGQSILIHSGAGGVGLATINICTYYKCNIFVTVGTAEKREYLLREFPHLKPENLGNSHDTSFKEMIMRGTNGRGVDIIINSLAEEKLQASVECLARNGNFIEIGKYDMSKNNQLFADLTDRNGSYNGVMLDQLIMDRNSAQMRLLSEKLDFGIKVGFVKPLPRKCFPKTELEEAYRYMTTGRHIGKILIDIIGGRDAKDVDQEGEDAIPRVYCREQHAYVVLGGLGGFGLELIDWLILRGAKIIVCSTRNGITNGYQKLRIKLWKSYGVQVIINTNDVTTYPGCERLINETLQIAPIGGVFNLAVVLHDSICANQTSESMLVSMRPKALATMYLDELTRRHCPNLQLFVVFSSVSCGRGNAGQTNYGFANSIMERIMEQRHLDGLPACAIQWGAVGDVGLVAEMQKDYTEIAIGGSLQQKIESCLSVLDSLIMSRRAIVASMIVAEKKQNAYGTNMIEAIAKILGVKDVKAVGNNVLFSEMGMDSMMAVEMQQTLEREYDICVTSQNMKQLTFDKLLELQNGTKEVAATTNASTSSELNSIFNFDVNLLKYADLITPITTTTTTKNACKTSEEQEETVILFPGIDGHLDTFINLTKQLNARVACVMYHHIDHEQHKTIKTIAEYVAKEMKIYLKSRRRYKCMAHSLGCLLALEVAAMLDRDGYEAEIILLDGSPHFIRNVLKHVIKDRSIESVIIQLFISNTIANNNLNLSKLREIDTFKKFESYMLTLPKNETRRHDKFTDTDIVKGMMNVAELCKAITLYNESSIQEEKIKSRVHLIRAATPLIPPNLSDDGSSSDIWQLSKCCQNIETQIELAGDHVTLLQNEDVEQFIINCFNNN